MINIFSDINNVKKQWEEIKLPVFLTVRFLDIYYQMHPKVQHLFAMSTNTRLYAHIFSLTFHKARNYLPNNLIANTLLRYIKLDVLYLTNSFITNIPSFSSSKAIDLNQLLSKIKQKYSIIVIPDFVFVNMKVEHKEYTKIEVESEMILNIRREWKILECYLSDLKKKYRNNIKNIIKKTDQLEIENLNRDQLKYYEEDIRNLFNQVVKSSQFKGPQFNTDSLVLFVEQGFMKVDGYFIEKKLVGFSSLLQKEDTLYSYFVGFDKNINISCPIYGRILIENIKHAIKLKSKRLVLGRTANEYKSNFGALPIRSFIYLRVKNNFMNIILRPIYNRLRLNTWKRRHPFKLPAL